MSCNKIKTLIWGYFGDFFLKLVFTYKNPSDYLQLQKIIYFWNQVSFLKRCIYWANDYLMIERTFDIKWWDNGKLWKMIENSEFPKLCLCKSRYQNSIDLRKGYFPSQPHSTPPPSPQPHTKSLKEKMRHFGNDCEEF